MSTAKRKKPATGDCRFCSALTALGDYSHVVVMSDAGLTIGGQLLDDAQVAELAAEARTFRTTRLAQLFTSTLRDHAVKMGINAATTYDHLLVAKAMIYVADVNAKVLAALESEDKRRKEAAGKK